MSESLVVQVAVSAFIQGLVGLLMYVGIRRFVEQVDSLRKEVEELKTQRIVAMEARAAEDRRANEETHGELYREIKSGRLEIVGRISAAVTDLGRIEERAAILTKTLGEMQQRQIGHGEDIARLQAELKPLIGE
jgi:hypothetical protein